MKIIKVPDGQTEKSFRKVKINNIKNILDAFSTIENEIECFDTTSRYNILSVGLQLSELLLKLEGKIE